MMTFTRSCNPILHRLTKPTANSISSSKKITHVLPITTAYHGNIRHLSLSGLSTTDARRHLHRSYLYVPASSDKMLQKSLSNPSDVIIYDLEDSVAPQEKVNARHKLSEFLQLNSSKLVSRSLAVRVNDHTTPFHGDDIRSVVRMPGINILVLPKIHSTDNLDLVHKHVRTGFATAYSKGRQPLSLVASIESALAFWNLRDIASWKASLDEPAASSLGALLFAAEDFCADTSIVRTRSRAELLVARSHVVLAAKAYGLEAIDMVCVDYRDSNYLREECEDGRRLGFTGKQAIHPSQVEVIQSTFVPTEQEILRAVKIIHQMNHAHASKTGAFGLDVQSGNGGGKEMIDAPMLKQAMKTIQQAQAAGLFIPQIE